MTGTPELTVAKASTWPYTVGLVSLALGAVGLVLAPISGIVYVAIPGVVIATVWAFLCRCRARWGVAVSVGALVLGAAAFFLAVWSSIEGDFFVFEWSVLAGMLAFPLLALLVGIPSLFVARARPGERRGFLGGRDRASDLSSAGV